jgi:hypothetical protein
MPQNCSVCGHEQRSAIDAALVDGASLRDIAGRFPGLSKSALSRHRQHIAETIAVAQQALQIDHGGSLIAQVEAIKSEALTILNDVKGTDKKTALAALRRLLECVELMAKVQGAISSGTSISLTVSPEWARTREIILQALAPFPDARIAVATALQASVLPHASA